MKILRMKATFGGLDHQELTLKEGLNILQAPNEGGKSTWSAFLRAMLYGINTKERDKQGHIAEKNRYQPWNGGAMEGVVDLEWKGEEITLRRGPKGNTPFGKFEAVYTATGEPVPFLTADNVGEILIGAPREVFERSAFVGQGGTAIDGAPALEARIAALASSGEEDVSYSQVERRLRDWLNDGKSARSYLSQVDEEDAALIATSELLSLKPVIYAANLDEEGFSHPDEVESYQQVSQRAAEEGAQCIPVCAQLEAEIAQLDGEEKAMFLEDLGIAQSGLDRLINASYTLLGLISYLTAGEDECRAWTITNGTKAPQAAGKIHSDFERGFIRAETVAFEDLKACGSMAAAREKGLIRSEGKDYVVKDGDIILFRFNV